LIEEISSGAAFSRPSPIGPVVAVQLNLPELGIGHGAARTMRTQKIAIDGRGRSVVKEPDLSATRLGPHEAIDND